MTRATKYFLPFTISIKMLHCKDVMKLNRMVLAERRGHVEWLKNLYSISVIQTHKKSRRSWEDNIKMLVK